MRKTEFANGEYYHIHNRGVDGREVFLDEKDYERFLIAIKELNGEFLVGNLRDVLKNKEKNQKLSFGKSRSLASDMNLVEIIAYCLNSNHYHLMLKQKKEKGIVNFMHRLGTSYTKYFNVKNSRSGSLFQGPYKSIHIDSNEYLLLLSAYINANHQIHRYPEKDWPYSSFLDYTGKRNGSLCNKEVILKQFDNNYSEYEQYIQKNKDYFIEKKEDKKYILE